MTPQPGAAKSSGNGRRRGCGYLSVNRFRRPCAARENEMRLCPRKMILAKWKWLSLVMVVAILATGCDLLTSTNPDLDKTGLFSHEKMAVVVSRAWTIGEYKACQSYDSGKENDEPLLTCDSDGTESAKRFKVEFHGPTYIGSVYSSGARSETTFNWDCRKNNDDDLVFSCWLKAQDKPANGGQAQTPARSVEEPPNPVEECAMRFIEKGIYEINGKLRVAACKEDSDIRP